MYVCCDCKNIKNCACGTRISGQRICHHCGVLSYGYFCQCWSKEIRVKVKKGYVVSESKKIALCEPCAFANGCTCQNDLKKIGRCANCKDVKMLLVCECNKSLVGV